MARRTALISWVCTAIVLGTAPAAIAASTPSHAKAVQHTVSRHSVHHRAAPKHAPKRVSRRVATKKVTRTPAPRVTVAPTPVLTPDAVITPDPVLTPAPDASAATDLTTTAPLVTPAPVDTSPDAAPSTDTSALTAPAVADPITTAITATTDAAPADATTATTSVVAPPAPVTPLPRVAPVELNITPGAMTATQLTQALDLAKAAGASSIYSVINWAAIQPSGPDEFQWTVTDALVAGARARGLSLRFQITSTPDWVHPGLVAAGVEGWKRRMTPPNGDAQLAQWKTFVGQVAARYGSSVAKMEIWNEPNETQFWQPAPSAAQYVQVLKAGYEAIKAAAPQVQVLFGGISRGDIGYLTQFYAAADAIPGVPQNHWFDVLDVHPYCANHAPSEDDPARVWNGPNGTMDENFLGFERLHDVMLSHGEDKHVFLGEFGYSTQSTQWTPGVTDTVRAGYLSEAYRLAGAVSYVDGMNWYSFVANQWDGAQWTLLGSDFTPTATYAALVGLSK